MKVKMPQKNFWIGFIILILPITLHDCSNLGRLEQGKHELDNFNFARAIRLFKEIPPEHPDHETAELYLISAYIRSCRYDDARSSMKTSGLPPDTLNELKKKITFHEDIYRKIAKLPDPFKKVAWSSPKPRIQDIEKVDDKKQKSHVILDIILNRGNDYKIRKLASMKYEGIDAVKENINNIVELLWDQAKDEQMLAFQVLANYIVEKAKNVNNHGNLKWPDNKVSILFRKWITGKINGGDREIKHHIVKLCEKIKDKTSAEIMLPLLNDPDKSIVNDVISVYQKTGYLQPVLDSFPKASNTGKSNIIEIFQRKPVPESGASIISDGLQHPDWKIQWRATIAAGLMHTPRVKSENKNEEVHTGMIAKHKPETNEQQTGITKPDKSKILYYKNLKNVILISIDMLRADRLGCYGFPEATSPYLDWFAKNNHQFVSVVANASWTLPSHASMLTSKYPLQHGVETPHDSLAYENATLAETIRGHSYLTHALVNNFFMLYRYGFHQGFDIYQDYWYLTAEPAVQYLNTWIGWHKTKWLNKHIVAPYFFFLHLNDVHDPYPFNYRPYPLMFEHLKPHAIPEKADNFSMYHSMVYYVDKQLGHLFAELRKNGLESSTCLIITSDHGEGFGEHGYYSHFNKGYDEEIKVPLLAHLPDVKTAENLHFQPVQIVDIPVTVLDYVQAPVPNEFQGISLFSQLSRHGKPSVSTVRFSETIRGDELYRSLFMDSFKYKLNRSYPDMNVISEELYDLESDPGERDSLVSVNPDILTKLQQELAELETGATESGRDKQSVFMDHDLETALKNLGYLNDSN